MNKNTSNLMQKTILDVQELTFQFPQHEVFNNYSTTIATGITWLIGGESSGKSTLLRLFSADLAAQSGHIELNGINPAHDLTGYKLQVFWIDPRTTAHDQVTPNHYFDLQRGFYPSFDHALLLEMIQGLGLTDHVSKSIYMLSAGSKRKIWLAAAFASGAALSLLDEPFAALDKASIGFLLKQLEKFALNQERAWVIADYEASTNLSTSKTIDLSDLIN
jgi:ABC-type multidrug transport system ATPase subunit